MKLYLFALVCLLLCACSSNEKSYTLTIEKPFSSIQAPSDSFTLQPAESRMVKTTSGSTLVVPAWAFVDAKGDTIKTPVKLVYQEINDAASIIASGIPMTVEDSGKTRTMESAGMFEIKAFAGSAPVYLAKNKKIGVNMASEVEGSDYDLFYLEPGTPVVGATLLDAATQAPATRYRWNKIYTQKNTTENEQASNLAGKSIKIRFNKTEYPETSCLEEIDWKQIAEDKNQVMPDLEWNQATLTPSKYARKKIASLKGELKLHYNESWLSFEKDLPIILKENEDLVAYNWVGKELSRYKGFGVADLHYNSLVAMLKEKRYLLLPNSTVIPLKGKGWQYITTENIFTTEESNDHYSFICYNMKGNIQWEKKTAQEEVHFDVLESKSLVTCILNNELVLMNLKGEIQNKLSIPSEMQNGYPSFVENRSVVLLYSNADAIAWNYKENKNFRLDPEYQYYYLGHSLQVMKDHHNFLWNIDSDTYHPIEWKSHGIDALTLPGNMYWVDGNLYDINMLPILSNLKYPSVAKNNRSFTVERYNKDSSGFEIFLYTDGKLMHNFSKANPDILHSNFIGDSIYSIKIDGSFSYHNLQGEALSTDKIIFPYPIRYLFPSESSNKFLIYSQDRNLYATDSSGNIISELSEPRWLYLNQSFDRLVESNRKTKTNTLYDLMGEKLSEGSYSLRLKKEEEEFTCYVRISENDLDKYYQYKKLKGKKESIESERQQKEAALIRSFEIEQFGIYNWDRIYKDEDALIVKLQLSGDLPDKEYSNATLFHITGLNETAVIKYSLKSMDSFAFKPKEPNRLLLVLEDGRTSTVETSAFNSLNEQDIRRSKKLKLTMKAPEKPQDLQALRKMAKDSIGQL